MTWRRPRLAARLVFFSLLLLATEVSASGFFLSVRGVRPLGRGGAAVVSGGGLWASWYNPAQLSALEGTHIHVDLSLVSQETSFLRTPRLEPNGDLMEFLEVGDELGADFIPALLVSSDFGVDGLGVGFALMPPFAARYRYPEDGPQRYSVITNEETLAAHIGLSLSYEPIEWLRLGASLQNLIFDTKLVTTASAFQGPFGQPEDRDLDILMEVHSVDPFTLTANFGIWAQIVPELELAVAYQTGATIQDDQASIRLRLPAHPLFDGAVVEGDQVSGGFSLAGALRAGIRFIHPMGDVEFNVTWENWSVHDAISTTPDNLRITGLFQVEEMVVGPLTVVQDWQDTLAFSLGGDINILPDMLTARLGIIYEQSAVPDARLSVFQIDLEKVAPTLGLTFTVPETPLSFDLAFAHFFMFERIVADSAVQQINPTYQDGATVVGNGTYGANINIFGLGLEATF